MSNTITVRLPKELAEWLAKTAAATGVPQGRVIRDQLEQARASSNQQAFMRLAGCVKGKPRDLSMRKGYSRG